MPDGLPPSEFGGHTNALGIPAPPHVPTASEKLRAVYLTGDDLETAQAAPQPGREAFQGLLPEAEQRAILEARGAFEKGEVWEEMLEE